MAMDNSPVDSFPLSLPFSSGVPQLAMFDYWRVQPLISHYTLYIIIYIYIMKIPLTIINIKLLTSIALFYQRAQPFLLGYPGSNCTNGTSCELRVDVPENHGYHWDIQWEMDVLECFCFFLMDFEL